MKRIGSFKGWKVFFCVFSTMFLLLSLATLSVAGDDRSLAGQSIIVPQAMPALGTNEYGTDVDNEDNFGSGSPDGDMDYYMFNDDPLHPIEFNVNIPKNVSASPATIRMSVYDVDTDTIAGNPEIDDVFVNGIYVGTLNGADSTWGENVFNIPVGTLKNGNNLVQIKVDQGNIGSSNWAVTIDWAIIKVTASATVPTITKAWFSPVIAKRGDWINAFAEVSGAPSAVKVFNGTVFLFELTDPDGDHTYSGQFQIPQTWTNGLKSTLKIKAYNSRNAISSTWPGIKIVP